MAPSPLAKGWRIGFLLLFAWMLRAQVPIPAGLQSLDSGWVYRIGDDGAWAKPELPGGGWAVLPSLRKVRGSGPTGALWFRRTLKVVPGTGNKDLALALGRSGAAFEIYADGQLVGRSGSLGASPEGMTEGPTESLMATYALPAPGPGTEGSIQLAIRANLPINAALLSRQEGTALGREVWVGPAPLLQTYVSAVNASAEAERLRGDQTHWALTLTFLIVGVFHLQLFSRRRTARYYLWFGLVAVSMGLREAAMTGWANGPLGHPEFANWASWIFLFASAPPFIEFLWPFLGRAIPRWLRVYQLSYLIPSLILFLPLATAAPITRAIGPWWGLPIMFLGPWVVGMEAWRGSAEAKTILLGMLLMILGALYELGYWMGWWPFPGTLSMGFAAFLVCMAISVSDRYGRAHAETEALNRTLEQRVTERTAELEDAQARVHRLTVSSQQALRDPGAWSELMANELCSALDANSVEVWRMQDGAFARLTLKSGEPPSVPRLETLMREPSVFATGDDVLLPVTGMSGELRAAVVVKGKRGAWSESEKRLLATFVSQLAGALDLSRMRAEVEAATLRRAATRQALMESSAGLLQICPSCHRCYDHVPLQCSVDSALLESRRIFPYHIAGRYRLTRFLGEGAMGLVFEAHDERLRRTVALKAIKPEHFHSQDKRLRFEQEARALAQVQHPGVIAIFDSGELEDGTIYLVTERLVGATLRTLLDISGPGTPAQVASLLLQCAEALDAAHAVGLVHRDIKPDNIFAMASPDGLRFKLLDFGLAKEMAVDSTLTQTGVVIGTPLYMSPEQIRGEILDARSDFYALAVVGFEALSGRRLVQSQSLPDILMEVAQGTPTPLRDLVPGLPPKVGIAFDQALAKEPWQRPGKILDWALALAPRLLMLRLDRRGWPEDLQDIPASGLSSSHPSATPASHEAMTRIPGFEGGDEGEKTQQVEKRALPQDDLHGDES